MTFAASDLGRRSTPTHEGAAACADFAGWIGRDDFDPALPSARWIIYPRLRCNRHKSLSGIGLASLLFNVNRLAKSGTTGRNGQIWEGHAGPDGQPGRDGSADRAVF